MRPRGFTLLEVMIAMAILAGSLTWLVLGMSRNIQAENHAKLMSTATFLVRQKMIDFEDELYEKGFGEFENELTGNFEDKGFARYSWKTVVDKVELPSSEQLQTVLTNAQQAKQQLSGQTGPQPSTPDTGGNPLSASAGALGQQFGIIKDVLEQAIRRVTIKVAWLEGKKTEDVTLIAYYTDVRKVDQAIQLAIPAGLGGSGGAGAAGGAAGTGSGTGSGAGTQPH